MRILVSGSLAYDKIMEYPGRFSDHIMRDMVHTLNVSFVTENLSEHFGGTAGNIAYGLALLGEKPSVLATVGKDFEQYRTWLTNAGVDVDLVRVVPEKPTAFMTIMTDNMDNQITAVYLGAMTDSCEIRYEEIPPDSFAIVAPGNAEDMRRLPKLYPKKNTPFIFDPGQQIPALDAQDIKDGITGAKAFISNDYELSLVLQKTGWTEEDILSRAEMLVTTLGEKGSRIRTGKDIFDIPPARAEKVLDPTGGGDAYRAGFIKGLLAKWPLEVTGRFASVVAAFAIEVQGSQGYKLTMDEARSRYAENFGTELPNAVA